MGKTRPWIIACAAFLLLASLAPSAGAEAIRSEDFQLVGPDGRVSAKLTTSSEGTPALFFFDKQGRNRMNAFLYPEGHGGVVLNDQEGRAAAILRLHGAGERPVLVLKADGQDKMVLGLRDDGARTPYIEPFPEGGGSPASGSSSLLVTALVGLVAGAAGGRLFKGT